MGPPAPRGRALLAVVVLTAATVVGSPAVAENSACYFDSAAAVVHVVAGGYDPDVVIEREGGVEAPAITINGDSCLDTANGGIEATVLNTAQIRVDGTNAVRPTVEVDLANGQFAPGSESEAGAHDDIELVLELPPFANVTVRGGPGADHVVGGDLGANLNTGAGSRAGAPDADADIVFARTPDLLTLYGRGGADELSAVGGSGTGESYAGETRIWGGLGNDVLSGGVGFNSFFGGAGGDVAIGGPGPDSFASDPGDDTWDGGGGNDYFYQGEVPDGADTIAGGAGIQDSVEYDLRSSDVAVRLDGLANDGAVHPNLGAGELDSIDSAVEWVSTGAGDDRITGDNTAEWIFGGAGSDHVRGRGGADSVFGGPGSDTVSGGPAQDGLFGENGADAMVAADGFKDTVDGGDGTDTCTCDTYDDVTAVP